MLRAGHDRVLAGLCILLLILQLVLLLHQVALRQCGVFDVGEHGHFELLKRRILLLLLHSALGLAIGVVRRDRLLLSLLGWRICHLAFVEDHLFACLGLAHVVLGQWDGPLALSTFLAFAKGTCSVARHNIASHASLNQEGVAARVSIGKVEVLCDSKRGELDRVSLHLEQVVAPIIRQERHLDGSLCTTLSNSALL